MQQFHDKVAVITGAGRRIGRGSVGAGDVTAKMIEDAQQDLLRPLDDL